MMTQPATVKLKLGQVWKSRDPREKRMVVVRGFEGEKVLVQNTEPRSDGGKPSTTRVHRDRFKIVTSRGYELVSDVP